MKSKEEQTEKNEVANKFLNDLFVFRYMVISILTRIKSNTGRRIMLPVFVC